MVVTHDFGYKMDCCEVFLGQVVNHFCCLMASSRQKMWCTGGLSLLLQPWAVVTVTTAPSFQSKLILKYPPARSQTGTRLITVLKSVIALKMIHFCEKPPLHHVCSDKSHSFCYFTSTKRTTWSIWMISDVWKQKHDDSQAWGMIS